MRTLTPENRAFWQQQLDTLPAAHQALILRLLTQHYGSQLQPGAAHMVPTQAPATAPC